MEAQNTVDDTLGDTFWHKEFQAPELPTPATLKRDVWSNIDAAKNWISASKRLFIHQQDNNAVDPKQTEPNGLDRIFGELKISEPGKDQWTQSRRPRDQIVDGSDSEREEETESDNHECPETQADMMYEKFIRSSPFDAVENDSPKAVHVLKRDPQTRTPRKPLEERPLSTNGNNILRSSVHIKDKENGKSVKDTGKLARCPLKQQDTTGPVDAAGNQQPNATASISALHQSGLRHTIEGRHLKLGVRADHEEYPENKSIHVHDDTRCPNLYDLNLAKSLITFVEAELEIYQSTLRHENQILEKQFREEREAMEIKMRQLEQRAQEAEEQARRLTARTNEGNNVGSDLDEVGDSALENQRLHPGTSDFINLSRGRRSPKKSTL